MNNSIQKWLELIESDEQLYKDLVEKKSKYEATEAGLHKFLRKDFIPLAQSYGFEFSEEDLLEFQKQKMQKLDDDVLENIAGGKKNNMIGWGLLSILLLSSLPIGCMLVDRNEKPVDSLVNMSTDKKIKDNENLRNSTTTVNSDQFDNEDDDNNTTIFSKINKNGRDKRKKRNPSIYHETRSDVGKGGPLFRSSNNENLSKLMNVLENNKLKEKLKGSEGMLTEKKNVADRFAQQSTNERQEDQQRQNQSENKIGHNEREFDRLKKDLNNANEELSGSQETVKQSREGTQTDSLNVAKDEIDSLQGEVSEVKAELTRAQQTEKQANDESQRVGSEIAEERAKLVNLQSEIERQKEEINKVQAELAKAQQTERQANDERDQAREEERKSQLELSVVQDRSANQERENTNLKNQLKTLEGQLAEVRRQSEVLRGNLEREKSEKDEKSAELQKQLIEAKRKTDELKEQLTQETEKFSTVQVELTKAQQALEQANNEKQRIGGEIAEERSELVNLQSGIDRLQGEVSEVKAELTRAQQTERQANDERDQAREEERKSQLELSVVQDRSANQERENTNLKNQLKTLEGQLAEVRRQSEVLRGNLEREKSEKDEKSAELQKQLIEAKRKTDELKEQLTQETEKFSTVQVELTKAQQALEQANNEKQRIGGEIAEERSELVNLQSGIDRLQGEVSEVKAELTRAQQTERQANDKRGMAEQERDQARKERKLQLELSDVRAKSAYKGIGNTDLANQQQALIDKPAEKQSKSLSGILKSEKRETQSKLDETTELQEQLTQDSITEAELDEAQQAKEEKFDSDGEKNQTEGTKTEERDDNLQKQLQEVQTVSAQGQLGEPPQEQSTEHSQEQKNGDAEPLQEVKEKPKYDGQGSMTEVYSKTEGTLESKAKEMPVQDSDQLQSLSSSPKTLAQLIKEAAKGIVQLRNKGESRRFEGESEEGNVISAARTCIQFNDLSELEEYSATCVRQALIMYVRGTLNDATESSDRIETVEKILGKILCFREDEINAISSGPKNKKDEVRKRSIDPNYAFEEWFVQLVKGYNNKDKYSQDFVSRILRNRVICGGEVNQLEICKELKSKLFEEKDKIFGAEVDDSAKNEAPEKENLKLPPDQVVECTTKNLPNDTRTFCFMNSVLQQLYRIDGLRKYNKQMLLNLREINERDLNNEQKSEMEVRSELEKIFKYMDAKGTEVVELEVSVEGDYKGIHEGFIAFGTSHEVLRFVDEIKRGLNDYQEANYFTMFMKKFFPDYIFGDNETDENKRIVDLNPKKDIMVIMNSVQALEMSKYEKELTGFVLHTGSVHSGHYISYVKENGVWFIIDDIHGITEVDQHEVTDVITGAKDLMKRENEINQENMKVEVAQRKLSKDIENLKKRLKGVRNRKSRKHLNEQLEAWQKQAAQYNAEKQKLVKAKEDLYKEYSQNPRITLCRYTKLS